MPHEDRDDLRDLLTTFDATWLGGGDTNAGANLLASMAGALANLAPTDGTVLTKDGRPARLGVSLLVTGAAGAGLIRDEVLTEIGLRQVNAWRHFQRYGEWVEERRLKPGATLPPTGARSNAAENCFAENLGENEPLFHTTAEAWGRALREPPAEQLQDVIDRPKFFVSAARPGDLENQLQGLRPGRPLVHLGLGQPGDLAKLAAAAAALVEGRFTLGTGCETVCANLLITDPMGMLGEAANALDDRTSWLGHFLWLCDGEAGPEVAAAGQASDDPETTAERFRLALDHVIARRLDLRKKVPTLLALDTREATVRWTAFLREMGPHLPGISYAARNLISSLAFGLGEMAKIGKGLPVTMAGVEAFARFLVRRMANARTAMLRAAELAERQSQIERVYWKLQSAAGRIRTRSIYRDLRRLPAAVCREILRWMEAAGLACRVDDDAWVIVDGAVLDFDRCPVPLLEA